MQNSFSKFYDFDEYRQHILLLKLLRIFSIFLTVILVQIMQGILFYIHKVFEKAYNFFSTHSVKKAKKFCSCIT